MREGRLAVGMCSVCVRRTYIWESRGATAALGASYSRVHPRNTHATHKLRVACVIKDATF